uniref:Uncharacterized protein n=1 Tax=Glossina austeni TaxID=7395 RepID=A0A1A9UDK2_GLOAU
MSQTRLPLVSTEILTNHIVAEPLLTEDQKCNKFLIGAVTYQLMKVTQLHEKCQRESKHCNESFHVFLLGGTRNNATGLKVCKVYDISKKKLVSSSSMNEGIGDNSAVSLNGVVYSVGGYNDDHLNTTECYDPASK